MAEVMAFNLRIEAEKKWRKLKGYNELENLSLGRLYKDGELVDIEEQRGRLA